MATTRSADYPSLVALADLTVELRNARQATERTVLQRGDGGALIGSLKLPPPDPAPIIERGRKLLRKIATEHLQGSAWHLELAIAADFCDAAGPEYAAEAADIRQTLVEEGFRPDSL